MSDQELFSGFPPISTEKWEEKILEDLKGADYEKKLVWQNQEGIAVRPYYREEDLKELKLPQVNPGEFPYLRGNKKHSNDWEIRQDIFVDSIKETNAKALTALNRGATSIGFIFDKEPHEIKKMLNSQADFSKLLQDIYFECIDLNFVNSAASSIILVMLYKEALIKKVDITKISGSLDYDPLGDLTLYGKFACDEDEAFSIAHHMAESGKAKMPNFRILGVNGKFLHNAGSSIVEELAYSLSMGNEYLARLTTGSLTVDDIASRIQFNFATGSNYFMEIAKYRAARLLWSNIVNAYNPKNEKSCRMYIHSVTSDWNKTIYDPYVNMLRSTTESMSSILGCVDSHTVKPFNSVFNIPGEFSERIARNTQIILKEEAYFDKIVDPAGGSYYIESLTQSIAEQAWKLFLETEKEGGYTKAFKKGIVQNRIEASANKKLEALSTRKETIVGTNQYPNYNEHVKTSIIPELLKYPVAEGSDLVAKPVKRFRAACNFEDLRLRTEKHKSGRPKVFLLTCGNLSMRRARAQFAGNFFACAGYEIIDNNGFKTIDAGIKAALENKAAIVVLCSSDDDYATIAPEANEKLKDKAILVVAGSPSSMDELKAKGIKHFVHLRSNLLETLSEFHKELGIK